MFYFTGFIRTAENIAKSVTHNIDLKEDILNQINKIVTDALGILNGSGSLDDFGRLLHETWIQKIKLSKFVTNDHIDDIYNIAINSGLQGI